MADVARRARVSIKTVSRVVNGERGVSATTATRVQRVIGEVGFQRHAGASLLRSGRSESIGFITPDLANPFYSQLAAGIEREARVRRHFLVSTSCQNSADHEAALVDALVGRRVAGLIVVPVAEEPSPTLRQAARSVPVVCVDRPQPGLHADTVLSDNEGGMRGAVEHLAAHRHERIGFLGDDATIWTARQRHAAFGRAAASLGLPGPLRCVLGPYPTGQVAAYLLEWTSGVDAVTAVVTGNNRVTLAVLTAMRELGLRLGLVGYDDFELADVVDPPVTVVHQDPLVLGERAVQQVFARLAAGPGEPTTVVVPTRLVVRASGRRTASCSDGPVTRTPVPLTWRIAGLAGLFVASGTLHLVRPQVFLPIVPRELPAREELVYASGVAELVCAAGLAVPATRAAAGWSSAALLVGVFPANVQMTVTAVKRWRRKPDDPSRLAVLAGTVARLPLQWNLVRVALSATGR